MGIKDECHDDSMNTSSQLDLCDFKIDTESPKSGESEVCFLLCNVVVLNAK